MSHLSYEDAKKGVFKGLLLLGALTLVEVFISLLGTGNLGFEVPAFVRYSLMIIIGALSIYKAYFIIFDFMHMRYEVGGLAWTVLMPTALLIWAVVAFFNEGKAFGSRRANYGNTSGVNVNAAPKKSGHLEKPEVYHLR